MEESKELHLHIGVHLDVDTLFVKHIGQLGKFQIKVLIVISFATIFSVFHHSAFIFTTARISARCRIPECDDIHTKFAPSWILNAVPGSGVESLEQCSRYRYSNVSAPTSNITDTCPAFMFDQNMTMKCDSDVIYENDETIAYDFDLGCNEWQRSFVGTIKNFGCLLGISLMGIMSDRIGRKKVLIINVLSACCTGVLRYWAKSYIVFVTLEAIESFLTAGCFECCYVLLIENVGPDYREVASTCIYTLHFISNTLISLIAWLVPQWRNLTLVLYAPQISIISYCWLMPESLRWLISKGYYDKAEKSVKIIAKTNNKTVTESVLLKLQETTLIEKQEKETIQVQRCTEPSIIKIIFKEKLLLLRCLVVPIWWITNVFIYQGLSINAVNLSGNKYFNFFIVELVDVPGFLSASFLMKRMGRKVILAICYIACALCQIGNMFADSETFALSLTLYLFGKFTIAAAAAVLYPYSSELFPTKYRQSLIGYCSTLALLGALIAPLTPALSATISSKVPYAIYGGLALLSTCVTSLTPETRGLKLPDTIEDIIRMKLNK